MIEEQSLRYYLTEKNSSLFEMFRRTEDKVSKDVLDYLSQEGFTGHGRTHCETIERKLNEFLPINFKKNMSAIEIYLLLNSIYLHDVGMLERDYPGQSIFEIRSLHHQRSKKIIKGRYKDFFLEESTCFRIADISYAHGVSDLNEFDEIDYIDGYGDIRLKLLMALLRIGDVLDWAKSRAPILTKEILKVGSDSCKYWIDHNFIESIKCDSNSFQLEIIGIPRGKWSKDKLSEIQNWFQRELDILSPIFESNGLSYKKVNLKIQKYKLKEYTPERAGKNPFQFLLSYNNESRDLYFGRQKELTNFIENIFTNRYLFLLGESGIGKTSFIQAGLIPIFEELEIKPIYIENYHNGKNELLMTLQTISEDGSDDLDLLLKKITDKGLKIAIVLDQFEKNLYDYSTTTDFLNVIEKIVRSEKSDVKIMFALRDDFTKNLWDFSKERKLNLLNDRNLFTLYKPAVSTIKEIVNNSLKTAGIYIKDEELNIIIEDLFAIHQKSYIFLPDLQIVFSVLCEEHLISGEDLFLLYKKNKGSEAIITDYFAEKIWKDFTEEEKNICRTIIVQLTTLDGIREQLDLNELLRKIIANEELVKNLLGKLINKRIIKRFVVERREYYELIHDFMAKKYSETMTEEEKMKKSLNEMLRHSLSDWMRHGIVIDEDKLRLIMKHFNEISLTDDIRKLIIRAICMHSFYAVNDDMKQWITALNITSKDMPFLLELLRAYVTNQQGYNNLIYPYSWNLLGQLTDIQEIAITLLENSSDINYCECLVDKMIVRWWHQDIIKHEDFSIRVVKFLNAMFVQKKASDDTKTLKRILIQLINANNMKNLFEGFGANKDIVFGMVIEGLIESSYSWMVFEKAKKIGAFFKEDLIRALKLFKIESEERIYHPCFVAIVRALELHDYFDKYTHYLLDQPSYGNVAAKREMILAIAAVDPQKAEDTLITLLADSSVQIIKDAAENIARIGTKKSLIALQRAMEKSRSTELVAIKNAIEAIESRVI
ncbi:MAG: hypothetical protein CVU62_09455 [Deltaproteobacteria bacterium HGW-Deltaproteobacteria-2]|jgi:hypothetical protein|nr:MAG: hypothetical protein CVU62_09455 [Deltaproteobacteria bacterium HGW-Deltaproteobacteria-2]